MPDPLTGDAYFALLEKTAARVDNWPDWKKGGKRMPDPDPKVTVPSDGDLRQEAAEWLANLNSASDEEIIVDLFNRWCQVRDRTREATLKEMGALLGAAEKDRK